MNPCHENGIEAGKGQSHKSQDHRHFCGCNACHAWYDYGCNGKDPSGRYEPTWEGKTEMFNRCYKLTMDIYFGNGWLKVAA